MSEYKNTMVSLDERARTFTTKIAEKLSVSRSAVVRMALTEFYEKQFGHMDEDEDTDK